MAAEGTDAFKDRWAEAQATSGRPELAYQSVGRVISPEEKVLAAAMMEIYGAGAVSLSDVAEKLSERAIVAPMSGQTAWDADLLEDELRAANETLDASYQAHGYGA
jgi:hypothetical protein